MALDTHVVHTDLNYLIPDGFESAPKSVKLFATQGGCPRNPGKRLVLNCSTSRRW